MDGPNQEAPGELVRNPHSLPSLFQMMKLDAGSNGLACNGSCAQRESLETLPQTAHPSGLHTGNSTEGSETKLVISCNSVAQGASSLERR